MPQFTVPTRFAADLRQFDPLLRCRWSDALDAYVIERKVTRSKPIAPNLLADDEVIHRLETEMEQDPSVALQIDARIRFMFEEYHAACDGYMVLFEVERNSLDERVFFTLFDTDIWRQGGPDAVNNKIDQRIATHEAQSHARFRDEMRGQAKEYYRYAKTVRTLPESAAHTAPHGGMEVRD